MVRNREIIYKWLMFEKQFLSLDIFCAFLDSVSVLMLLEITYVKEPKWTSKVLQCGRSHLECSFQQTSQRSLVITMEIRHHFKLHRRTWKWYSRRGKPYSEPNCVAVGSLEGAGRKSLSLTLTGFWLRKTGSKSCTTPTRYLVKCAQWCGEQS